MLIHSTSNKIPSVPISLNISWSIIFYSEEKDNKENRSKLETIEGAYLKLRHCSAIFGAGLGQGIVIGIHTVENSLI